MNLGLFFDQINTLEMLSSIIQKSNHKSITNLSFRTYSSFLRSIKTRPDDKIKATKRWISFLPLGVIGIGGAGLLYYGNKKGLLKYTKQTNYKRLNDVIKTTHTQVLDIFSGTVKHTEIKNIDDRTLIENFYTTRLFSGKRVGLGLCCERDVVTSKLRSITYYEIKTDNGTVRDIRTVRQCINDKKDRPLNIGEGEIIVWKTVSAKNETTGEYFKVNIKLRVPADAKRTTPFIHMYGPRCDPKDEYEGISRAFVPSYVEHAIVDDIVDEKGNSYEKIVDMNLYKSLSVVRKGDRLGSSTPAHHFGGGGNLRSTDVFDSDPHNNCPRGIEVMCHLD